MARNTVWGLAVLLVVPAATAADDTKEFFNGKDLTGWEGLIDRYWKVENGAIVGHSSKRIPHNTFLCSKKKYRDFELEFSVRIVDEKGRSAVRTRNSGVQIRSSILDRKRFTVRGPQCDIGGGYWGSLYGEHFGGMMKRADPKVVAKALKPKGFNRYSIRCVGKHVTIKINGHTTVDGDFPKMPDEGIVAWQLHSGGPMTITFKDIRFRDLTR